MTRLPRLLAVAALVLTVTPAPVVSAAVTCAEGLRGGDREPSAWKNAPIEEAAATGKRFYDLPLSPARVHAALNGAG